MKSESILKTKNIENIRERFQFFLDQISEPGDITSDINKRQEFFRRYCLIVFANLNNTAIYDRLNINEVNFELDGFNNLHITVSYVNKSIKNQKQILMFEENCNF